MTAQFDLFHQAWTVRDECRRRHGGEPCIKTHAADGTVVETSECLDWCPVMNKPADMVVETRAAA